MNTTLFMSLDKHQIYLVSEGTVSFFIAIPSKEFNKTNISIELRGDYESFNINNNDLEYVKALVKDIYSKIKALRKWYAPKILDILIKLLIET